MITTMLWVVMIVWAVGIGVFYFFKSDSLKDDQTPSLATLPNSRIFEKTQKKSLPSKIPTLPAPLKKRVKKRVDQSGKATVVDSLPSSEKRTITPDRSLETSTAKSPQTKEEQSIQPETHPQNHSNGNTDIKSPSQSPITSKTLAQSAIKSIKTPDIQKPKPKPTQNIIHETAKPNGTFYSAQKISAGGGVTGRRGSRGDVVDFYKITATGNFMTLKLESDLEGEDGRFMINVYDAKQQQIGKISEKTASPLSLSVLSQAIYYIVVDLRDAPIETPAYTFHVTFN